MGSSSNAIDDRLQKDNFFLQRAVGGGKELLKEVLRNCKARKQLENKRLLSVSGTFATTDLNVL